MGTPSCWFVGVVFCSLVYEHLDLHEKTKRQRKTFQFVGADENLLGNEFRWEPASIIR